MGLCSVNRFIVQGFVALLLVDLAHLSSTKKHVHLTSDVLVEANHSRSLGRIVNGTAASLAQFPHQVSLRYTITRNHFCGGNIVSQRWILTAAHCMFQPNTGAQLQPWQILVVAGDLWLNQTSTTSQLNGVIRLVIHENWNSATYENDIALLRLVRSFTLDNYTVAYSQLQINQVPVGTVCQVAGWGYPASNVPYLTNELMYVDVPIISQQICRELYIEFSDVPEGMICAGYMEGLRDACQGDSGGGLICDGMLTGVVSWGEGCAWPNYPGVYADVRFYRDWISRYIEDNVDNVDDSNGADGAKFSLWTKLWPLIVTVLMTRAYNNF